MKNKMATTKKLTRFEKLVIRALLEIIDELRKHNPDIKYLETITPQKLEEMNRGWESDD